MDAVANRVRRVAPAGRRSSPSPPTASISRLTLFELCEAFYALRPTSAPEQGSDEGPGTRLRLRTEVLAGTWEALLTGQADLAIGVGGDGDDVPRRHRTEAAGRDRLRLRGGAAPSAGAACASRLPTTNCCATARSRWPIRRSALTPLTVHLLPGRTCSPWPAMQAKLEAQLRCLGCGYPARAAGARRTSAAGRLVVKRCSATTRACACATPGAAAPAHEPRKPPQGWRCAGGCSSSTAQRRGTRCSSGIPGCRRPLTEVSAPRRQVRGTCAGRARSAMEQLT